MFFHGFSGRSYQILKILLMLFQQHWRAHMTAITALKLVSSDKKQTLTPIAQKRAKLMKGLHEQLQAAKAKLDGQIYAPVRTKWIRNPATGEKRAVEAPKRVKEWFWIAEGGKVHMTVRYGARTLELAKGRNAVELETLDALPETIEAIKQAVQSGELDAQIEKAATSTRQGFKK
jgi:hypothetical protein